MKNKHMPRLRQERERRGWSRNHISEQVEVDVVTVGRWERGERLPHPLYRQRLCELFEMNAEDLGLFIEESPERLASAEESSEKAINADETPDELVHVEDSSDEDSVSTEETPTQQGNAVEFSGDLISSGESLERQENTEDLVSVENFAKEEANIAESPEKPASMVEESSKNLVRAEASQENIGTETWINDEKVHTLEEIVTITNPSRHGRANEKISVPSFRQRRKFLIGLGGLGIAALAGGSIMLATHRILPLGPDPASALPLVLTQPSQQFSDAVSQGWVNRLAWSPDNLTLAAATGTNIVTLWDWEQGALLNSYVTLNFWVNDVCWSSTNWIAAATAQTNAGSLEIWRYPGSAPTIRLTRPYSIRGASWSPDGIMIAFSGHTSVVEVWNPFTHSLISQYSYPALPSTMGINRIRWSPSGVYLACGVDDGSVHVWEALSTKPEIIYRKHKGRVIDIAWSPDGQYIASSGVDGTTHVWEALSGKTILIYRGQNGIIEGVDWSLQGKYIATGGTGHSAHVWEALTGRLVARYENIAGIIETVLWSTDGETIALGTNTRGIEIWQAPRQEAWS